jgi:DNA polymerase III delta prime subunit
VESLALHFFFINFIKIKVMNEHTIWCEKYRPKTLDDYICNEDIKNKMKEYIDKQDIPHLLLPGTPGAGKTTLAKILVNNINCDFLYVNATDDRDMETIRNKVGSFASAASFKPLKIVILDEATHILQASQVLLLNMIETYSLKTRFILTGNYVERLIPALKSRLQQYDLKAPNKIQIAKAVQNILIKEQVIYTMQDIVSIVNAYYPDQRAVLNNCQKFTINNQLVIEENNITNKDHYINDIVNELKNPTTKSWRTIREIIANSEIKTFEELYKSLYDKIEEYSKEHEAEVILYLEQYQFESTSVLDKEICFMALISQILNTLNKK